MELIYENGRVWTLAELPPRSIALDGAVQGPAFDTTRQVWSFDHHGGCVRHATLATCEQVFEALLLGLDPSDYRVFLNDVDADSVLSLWLLQHPPRVHTPRVAALVHAIGRVDALGPQRSPPHPLHFALEPKRAVPRTRARLMESLALLDSWWRGAPLPAAPAPEVGLGLWIEDGALCRGEVAGFTALYQRADFGLIGIPAPGGSTAWTIGRRSEFVDFDVAEFLRRAHAIEAGWGGGSSIGGSPRHPDGSRSRLGPDAVGALLLATARG